MALIRIASFPIFVILVLGIPLGSSANNERPQRRRGKFNYTSTQSWKGYTFTSVCLSVCLCVCVCESVSVNKIPAERMHRFGRGFR